MRRKLLTYTLLAAIAGAVFWACRHDRFGQDDPNAVEPTLTVNEARDFFEYQMSEVLPYLTKLSSDKPVGMMPGDFTPLWNKATRAAANRWMEGVDLPIDPKFIFTAAFPQIGLKGDTTFRTVDIVQKLVVNRWHDHPKWEGMYAYIATLIPTPEYYARHKDFGQKFVNLGSKNRFSGIVVYHTLSGRFVNADKYQEGAQVGRVYDPENAPSLGYALSLLAPEMQVYGGTPAMYSMSIETPEVTVEACQRCGMQDCHCQASGGGCYCQTIGHEWDDHVDPTPPPVTPPGGTGGGGGGSTGSPDTSSDPKELMNSGNFVGYLTSGDCMQGCIRILANYGIRTYSTSTIIMATEGKNGQLNIYRESYIDGVNAINRHINAGRPVIVGISRGWGIGVGNSNPATDHFVVITGRGIDYNTGYYYYTYMETGTSNVDQGCDINDNRLYLNPDIPVLEDASGMNGDKYRVTEVRANDGN